jgi:preprotein translocase subunit SecG
MQILTYTLITIILVIACQLLALVLLKENRRYINATYAS